MSEKKTISRRLKQLVLVSINVKACDVEGCLYPRLFRLPALSTLTSWTWCAFVMLLPVECRAKQDLKTVIGGLPARSFTSPWPSP